MPSRPSRLEAGVTPGQTWIYVVVAALLVAAAALTVWGTLSDLVKGRPSRAVGDAGVFVLERVLLIFIIAKLLYTLRLVDFGGRILVEPFPFIGLIAVVRRILVVTAEVEGQALHPQIVDFLLQLGALGGLALLLALAIHVLRDRAGPPE